MLRACRVGKPMPTPAIQVRGRLFSGSSGASAAKAFAVHQKLAGQLGPTARLGPTGKAHTLPGPGAGQALDGPFAETKEQLLGLYVLHVKSEDEAIDTARQLRRTNPSAVYEIRPIMHYLPGFGREKSPTRALGRWPTAWPRNTPSRRRWRTHSPPISGLPAICPAQTSSLWSGIPRAEGWRWGS